MKQLESYVFFTVTGRPAPDVTWYFGDEKIVPGIERYHAEVEKGLHRLTIEKVDVCDAGQWTCLAISAFGQAVTTCCLSVTGRCHQGQKTSQDTYSRNSILLDCKEELRSKLGVDHCVTSNIKVIHHHPCT